MIRMFVDGVRRLLKRGERAQATAPAGFTYWAFISYSHTDEAWAKWLHAALERYRLPKPLIGRTTGKGVVPPRMHPVFRDRDELPGSPSLKEEIGRALERSRSLIVICSPHAAVSRYVNEETLAFKRLGRESEIHCLLVGGEPGASDVPDSGLLEAFPRAIRFRAGADGALTDQRAEPLAADVRRGKDARTDAKLKLVAGILGIGFDELKRRETRRVRNQRVQMAAAALVILLLIGGVWWNRQAAVEHQRQIALAQRLIDQATELLDLDDGDARQRAVLLIVQAMTRLDRRDVDVATDSEAAQARLAADQGLRRALAIFYTPGAMLSPTKFSGGGWTYWTADAVAFNADGQMLTAATSWDTSRPSLASRRWRVDTGVEVQHLARSLTGRDFQWATASDDMNRRYFALSPDGEYLAAISELSWAGEENFAIIYHLPSERIIARIKYQGRVRAMALSARAQHLAIAAQDDRSRLQPLQLWHVESGRPIVDIPDGIVPSVQCAEAISGNTPCPATLAFSPDNRLLAVAGDRVTLLALPLQAELRVRPGPALDLYRSDAVAFSADGRYLAATGGEATQFTNRVPSAFGPRVVRVWEIASARSVSTISPGGSVHGLALSAGGRYLALVDDAHSLLLRALANGAATRVYFTHRAADGTVDVSRSKDIRLTGKGPDARGDLRAVAFSPTDDVLALAGQVDAVVLRLSSFDEAAVLRHDSAVKQVAFDAGEESVVTLSSTTDPRRVKMHRWSLDTGGELLDRRREYTADIATFTPTGDLLLAVDDEHSRSQGGSVTVHGTRQLGPLRYGGHVERVLFSQDGRYVAIATGPVAGTSAESTQHVAVWDLPAQSEVLRFAYPTSQPGGGRPNAFFILGDRWYFGFADPMSREGGGVSTQYKLFDLKQRQEARERTDEVMLQWRDDLATSADQRWRANEVNDEVRVYAGSGPPIAQIRIPLVDSDSPRLTSRAVALSPRGQYVAVTTSDRTVRVWPVALSRLIEAACTRVGRELTSEEWQAYLPTEWRRPTCLGTYATGTTRVRSRVDAHGPSGPSVRRLQ